MKLMIKVLLLIGLAFSTPMFSQSAIDTTRVKIRVGGLACPFCAYGLEKKVLSIKGAREVKINVETSQITFYVIGKNDLSEKVISEKITEAGFTPLKVTIQRRKHHLEDPEKNEKK